MNRHFITVQFMAVIIVTLRSRERASGNEHRYFSHRTRVDSSTNKNVVFGVLLPLRARNHFGKCEKSKDDEGTLWLSALNYAVDDVNRKWKMKFKSTLTLKVRDTCSDERVALEQALDFANGFRSGSTSTLAMQENIGNSDISLPALGVISVSVHEDASTLLSLFKVPQIIFGKRETDVKKKAKNIFQSVSVGFYKAKALADLVKYFSWSAVSVVYSISYKDDFETFLRISRIESLCIAVKVDLSAAGETNYLGLESAVHKLFAEPQSTVVILFSGEEETKELLKTVKRKKSPVHWTWILASEQSAMCFPGNPQHNILMLIPQFPFLEGFRYYYENDNTSIGLNGIYALPRSCSRSIMARDPLSERRKEEIQASMNSVHLLAHAYETASQASVGQLDRAVFARSLVYVHNVLYTDEWKIFSNQRRMKQNMFSLIQARMNNSKNSLVNVGTWDSAWYINDHGIKWESDVSPRSSCGVQCTPGYIRVVKGDSKCCWSCIACYYNQIVTDEYTCADCLRGYWPNKDFTKCEFQWRRALFDCTLAIVAVVFVFSFMVL